MNFKTLTILLLSIIGLFADCTPGKLSRTQGLLIHKHRMYDSTGNEIFIQYEEKDRKIWFKDSAVIYEVDLLNRNIDENKRETWNHTIEKYTYLDLSTMVFYDYSSFSDTATMLRKYKLPDSAFVVWKFYRNKSFIPLSVKLVTRPDTVIKSIAYKRQAGTYSYQASGETITIKFTYYILCGMKDNIFHIDSEFDSSVNKDCAAVRFDYDAEGYNPYTNSTQYEFVSNDLTEKERKIFSQWKKNAMRNQSPGIDSSILKKVRPF